MMLDTLRDSLRSFLRDPRYRPLLEWGAWCLLVLLLWQQTDHFSQPMSEFQFGADGWPKAVLLLLLLGASAQMASDLVKQHRGQTTKTPSKSKIISKTVSESNTVSESKTVPESKTVSESKTKVMSWYQVVAVFCLPLVYVFLMRRLGFFLATPLFVLAYLWTMEVRRWQHLVSVTLVVFGLVLLVFVRFFYVALPVGSWEWAYAVNNFVIALVRAGL